MPQVNVTVLAALIACFGAVMAAIIPGAIERRWWIRRAKSLSDLYAALPKDDLTVQNKFMRPLLVWEAYDCVMHGLHYQNVDGVPEYHEPWMKAHRTDVIATAIYFAVVMCIVAPVGNWSISIGAAIGSVTMLVSTPLLGRWPKRPWNHIYMRKVEDDKAYAKWHARQKRLFALMEQTQRNADAAEMEQMMREIENLPTEPPSSAKQVEREDGLPK